MICSSPVRSYLGVFRCGRCMCCRVYRARVWTGRIFAESVYWSEKYFVTFTYDDDHLPEGNSLCKRDIQLFFKRLRKEYRLSYYVVGEYGDPKNTFRPHYHAIIFINDFYVEDEEDNVNDFERGAFDDVFRYEKDVDYDEIGDILKKYWLKGDVYVEEVNITTISYVCKYITKNVTNGVLADDIYGNKLRPFNLMSKGLGMRYYKDNEDRIIRDKCVTFFGRFYPVPRVFRDYLYKKYGEEFKEKYNRELMDIIDLEYNKKGLFYFSDIVKYDNDVSSVKEEDIKFWKKKSVGLF